MIISVINNKGGVGKTTTVANLAHSYARDGKRVLAVDLDSQANLLMHVFANKTINDIKTAQNGHALPPRRHEATGVDFLPLSFWQTHADDYADAIREASREYDVTLVDCPPAIETRSRGAMEAAHYIVIPIEPERLAVNGAEIVIGTMSEFSAQLAGIVVTMYDRKRATHSAYVDHLQSVERFAQHVITPYIPDSAQFPSSCRERKTLYEYARGRKSAATDAYDAVAREIAERVVL